jgi:hypothetical protein
LSPVDDLTTSLAVVRATKYIIIIIFFVLAGRRRRVAGRTGGKEKRF